MMVSVDRASPYTVCSLSSLPIQSLRLCEAKAAAERIVLFSTTIIRFSFSGIKACELIHV